MKYPIWEAVEHEDGSVHVQIDGVEDAEVLIDAFPKHMSDLDKHAFLKSLMDDHFSRIERKSLQLRFHTLRTRIATAESQLTRAPHQERSRNPPTLATAAFSMLTPAKSVDAQLGDLEEIFRDNEAKFGCVRARQLYWWQVLRAIRPAIVRMVTRIGIVSFVVEFVRRKIGF